MRVTTNMGLTAPSGIQDVYSLSTNAQNLYLIDYHDHSPGRGTRLTGASIVPGSLSGIHIADNSITQNELQMPMAIGTYFYTSDGVTYNPLITITHGLGATPLFYYIQPQPLSGTGIIAFSLPYTANSTTFTTQLIFVNNATSSNLYTYAPSNGTTINFNWFAVGMT